MTRDITTRWALKWCTSRTLTFSRQVIIRENILWLATEPVERWQQSMNFRMTIKKWWMLITWAAREEDLSAMSSAHLAPILMFLKSGLEKHKWLRGKMNLVSRGRIKTTLPTPIKCKKPSPIEEMKKTSVASRTTCWGSIKTSLEFRKRRSNLKCWPHRVYQNFSDWISIKRVLDHP